MSLKRHFVLLGERNEKRLERGREMTHLLKKDVGGGGGTNQQHADVHPRHERWRRRALPHAVPDDDDGGNDPPPLAPFDCDLSPRPIPSHPLTHDDCESERVEPPIR